MAPTCNECGLPMKFMEEEDGRLGPWYCDHVGEDDAPDWDEDDIPLAEEIFDESEPCPLDDYDGRV